MTTDLTERRIRDLIDDALTIEARMAGLGDRGAKLRAELTRRGVEVVERDGVAPTWRAPEKLGTVVFRYPEKKPKATAAGRAELASFLAERHPTEVTAQLAVPAELLPALLDLISTPAARQALPGWQPRVELVINDKFLDRFLAELTALDDDHLCTPDGQLVPGVIMAAGAAPSIAIRLNPEAKARAIAELADPEALALLTAPLGELPHSEHDDELGEPEYSTPPVTLPPGVDPFDHPLAPAEAADRQPAAIGEEDLALLHTLRPSTVLKVGELRALAGRLQLDPAGRKPELVERLIEFRDALPAADVPAGPDTRKVAAR